MFHVIDNLLNRNELLTVLAEVQELEFVDGRSTAGAAASSVKHNLQASDFARTDACKLVTRKLSQNRKFQAAALPTRISGLMLSKYQSGMAYGNHIDNPVINGGRIRSDIAMTLFLSEPESYDGGALEISMGSGADNMLRYKLAAGSVILYPAHYLHSVAKITSGSRLAIVGWVQSLVRDPMQRQILYDLAVAQNNLRTKDDASRDLPHLQRASSSLLRMWAEN